MGEGLREVADQAVVFRVVLLGQEPDVVGQVDEPVHQLPRVLAAPSKGEGLDHVEGDPMPSESEFVSTLDKRRPTGKVPPLEATEAQLRAFPPKPAAVVQTAPAAPAAPANYPPLESPAR